MSCHLEVWKPSGRALIALTGHRVTVGKASTNVVQLSDDKTVSRLHAVLENFGRDWSVRDLGSRNGTFVNGERIFAERVLRSGYELRIGNSRLIFWDMERADGTTDDDETETVAIGQFPPRLTPRELEVLVILCRPLVSDNPFPAPASVNRMACELFVTQAAIKQHLQNLYDKFAIPAEGERRVRLANEAIRRAAVTRAMLLGGDASRHEAATP
ncbi:FHA domain-containing protein [Rhodococcus daqingensis]|uniref:FHA domain-containing protein n=1 Tax=Rhodococcus daqingensis TaxID=2479363 RepID=A0ABW2S229_9NOCA